MHCGKYNPLLRIINCLAYWCISTLFHPEYSTNELPAHVYLRSVHNVSIERSWLRLRLDFGDNAVIAFERGSGEYGYNDQDPEQ